MSRPPVPARSNGSLACTTEPWSARRTPRLAVIARATFSLAVSGVVLEMKDA
jgi:hypothetical protein